MLTVLAVLAAAAALLWLDGAAEVLVYEVALIVVAVAWWRRVAEEIPAVAQHRRTRETSHRTAPSSLARIERVVVFATSGFEAEHRLLPLLRRIAHDRLAVGHGVDMELQPQRAAALLGEEAWALIDPSESHYPDSFPLDRIERVVAALERL